MIRPVFLTLALVLAPLPALAHKVIAAVYADGALIEGEVGFSNGDMAADATVAVSDPEGNPLGETATDADGMFTFRPSVAVAHVFHADLGAGHVAEVTMSAEDVAAILDSPAARAAAEAAAETGGIPGAGQAEAASDGGNPSTFPLDAASGTAAVGSSAVPLTAAPGLSDADKAAVAKIVRDEMRPLRREIAAYREKNDLQSILGGIGYIVGIFGLGFYVAARRRMKG
ncbi:cobalt ABC transporter permease [Rhodovulum sulfidophilum]|uniref:cobalt ABC transporter permease n=1 Tax=Rhodovulum sulfidophilum TaxID=35806 RepID=UPI001920EB8E|nr:cobalt ABC transporter permease [Rhodovulum sulfidophilum]MBL3572800.1 cobalt ABC transporter permease [Rhodovulum sulfidophilum]MCE8430369.1 cobalt ABC transporter permease [Rhodovulum sulfidophilum]MCF4117091.1 cobalt ABC transporter permease [Rhodovulum sulfidophilum]